MCSLYKRSHLKHKRATKCHLDWKSPICMRRPRLNYAIYFRIANRVRRRTVRRHPFTGHLVSGEFHFDNAPQFPTTIGRKRQRRERLLSHRMTTKRGNVQRQNLCPTPPASLSSRIDGRARTLDRRSLFYFRLQPSSNSRFITCHFITHPL